jgi:hypothetical protein
MRITLELHQSGVASNRARDDDDEDSAVDFDVDLLLLLRSGCCWFQLVMAFAVVGLCLVNVKAQTTLHVVVVDQEEARKDMRIHNN